MQGAQKVVAIILVYRSDAAAVVANLQALDASVTSVVVVDNSANVDGQRWSRLGAGGRGIFPIMNGKNIGVAAGWNAGIRLALEQGAEFVLLLDEDSVPVQGMVQALVDASAALAQAHRLAAVGPDFEDRTTGARALFVSVARYRIERKCCSAIDMFLPSAYLMSSGSLVHRSVFDDVGFMDERLFIDYVDTEWCLRAGSRGRMCFGVCGAHMRHAFGNNPLSVPWGNGRQVPERDPSRSYFICRNAFLLLSRSYLPLIWRVNELRRLVLLMGLYLVRSPRRWQHLAMAIRGVLDALRGRTGAMPGSSAAIA